jgi:LysM repeat protein
MLYRRGATPIFPLAALMGLLSRGVSAADVVHIVAKGETIYSISRSYKISQEELMRYNNLADASKLQAGMRLTIPIPAAAPAAYAEYTVAQNDTLYSIARSRGVTLQALRDINGFSKNYMLKTGEKIKIPTSSVSASVPASAPSTVIKPIQNEPVRASQKTADSSLRWPVAGKEIFYMNNNMGVLVSGQESESVKSLTRGTVVYASPWRGYGNVAVIESAGGYRYLYGACTTLSVKKGDKIEPGTELGKLGIYPASGKPELVLIVSQNGLPIDPAKAPRF